MAIVYKLKFKRQDLQTTEPKQMKQVKENISKCQNSPKQPPFIIHRQEYHQLNLYQRKGHWSQKEKLKYILFLDYFKERFQVKAKRRFNNIFDSMAIFIKTRNSHQCRSHHQKMQKQKFAIDRIINSVRQKYPQNLYNSLRQRYWLEIESLQVDKNQDFKMFKQRIQQQQEKKEIQRQKIAQNKRILRTRNTKTSNTQPNHHKRNKPSNHHHLPKETHHKSLPSQNHPSPNQQGNFKIQQVQNQQSSILTPLQSNKLPSFQFDGIQPIPTLPMNNIHPEILIQPYCFIPNNLPIVSDLQRKQKEHMDLAYFHYNQFLTHTANANNIQNELLKLYHSLMEGTCQL